MAIRTCFELRRRQIEFGMAGCNFLGLVVVAGIAIVNLVLSCMAGLTGHFTLAAVIHREGVFAQGGG